jgi:hypothetical protein
MSIQVNNTDNQLNIVVNGVLDVYNVKTIKSVSRAIDANGNHYISINFIANDKNNSVRIPLSEVTSPVGWTNDTTGAIAAVEDIRDWLSEVIEVEISEANDSILVYGYDGANNQPIAVDANGVLAIQDNGGSITVDGTVALDAGTLSALENVTVQNPGGASAVNIQDGGNSITVDGGTGVQRTPTFLRPTGSSGTVALGTYSMSFASVGTANATVGGITLKPGETLNFDAGAINNTLGAVSYSTTTAGAELIIITLT